ncbi:MAG: DUF5320 domain-containing protein [Syntrophobacteraceae bacterium]
MPRGDRTGPTGAGPRTGRVKGFCMGFDIPGAFNQPQDLASPGAGGGRHGRRNRFFSTGLTGQQRSAVFGIEPKPDDLSNSKFVPESELATLKVQASYLQKALDGIKRRMQELGAERKQQV